MVVTITQHYLIRLYIPLFNDPGHRISSSRYMTPFISKENSDHFLNGQNIYANSCAFSPSKMRTLPCVKTSLNN